MSAHGEAFRAAALGAGCRAFLAKPFEIEQLKEVVAGLLA